MSNKMYEFLKREYGNGDVRRNCSSISIDDRTPNDVTTHFCYLSVEFPLADSTEFVLKMTYPPLNDISIEIIKEAHGEFKSIWAVIKLNHTDVPFLQNLAEAIRRTVGRGQVYVDRNFRWKCPRTAKSLERLAKAIRSFNAWNR